MSVCLWYMYSYVLDMCVVYIHTHMFRARFGVLSEERRTQIAQGGHPGSPLGMETQSGSSPATRPLHKDRGSSPVHLLENSYR